MTPSPMVTHHVQVYLVAGGYGSSPLGYYTWNDKGKVDNDKIILIKFIKSGLTHTECTVQATVHNIDI